MTATENEEDKKKSRNIFQKFVQYKNVFCYIITVALAFTIFGLTIAIFVRDPIKVKIDVTDDADGGVEADCSSKIFMIGDGLCDEITNSESCAFDGGDCCKEDKSTPNCPEDCTCRMKISTEKLQANLSLYDVKVLRDGNEIVGNLTTRIEKTVTDVFQHDVCAWICLNTTGVMGLEYVNAWHLDLNNKTCSCIWIKETPCSGMNAEMKYIDIPESLPDTPLVFLMLSKSIPCDCFKMDKGYDNDLMIANNRQPSAWKCQLSCQETEGCEAFSWSLSEVSGITERCNLYNTTETAVQQKQGWESGPKQCI